MKIAFNPSTVAALTTPPNNKDITFDLRGHNIFARGVKFCGTDTNTWRDIKINNVSIDSNTLDLRDGDNTTLTNINGVVTINSTWRPVVDNLTSNSTTSSLSANQGRVLAKLINGKSDSDHNHDNRYLRLAGGWMSGDIYFGGDNVICWARNTDAASISFKNDGDADADSYMSFVTSDNGNEYFRWSHRSGSTNTEWMSLRMDGLRVGGTKVSLEGHTHNNLYYTKTEVNNKLKGKSDTSHTHDDRYLKLTGGSMTGTLSLVSAGSKPLILNNSGPGVNCICVTSNGLNIKNLNDDRNDSGINIDLYVNGYKVYNTNNLPAYPTSLKNPYALTISLNGKSQGPYDGSAAKNINITPGSIGAATSGHNHDSSYIKYTKVTKSTADNANATPYLYNVESEEVISGYYKYWYIFNMGQYSKGNFGTQIAMPYQDNLTDSELFIRSAKSGSWRTWRRILHSNNYTSYTVKKDGTGASGTWNININGNANSAIVWKRTWERKNDCLMDLPISETRVYMADSSTANKPCPGSGFIIGHGWDWGYGGTVIYQNFDDNDAGRLYTNSKQCNGAWQGWNKIAFVKEIPTVTNYYWANVKVSASSSTTTSPTVSNLTATSSIRMGNILLQNTNEINNSANGSISLNYRYTGNVNLCQGGGRVGIRTSSPLTALDVRSNEIAPLSVTGTIRLVTNPYNEYYYQPICVAVGEIVGAENEYKVSCNTTVTYDNSKDPFKIVFHNIIVESDLQNYIVFISNAPNDADFYLDHNESYRLRLTIWLTGMYYIPHMRFIIYYCKDGLIRQGYQLAH